MKVLKSEDMKQVKGGQISGPKERLCHDLMQVCWVRNGTVGQCIGDYVNCMMPQV